GVQLGAEVPELLDGVYMDPDAAPGPAVGAVVVDAAVGVELAGVVARGEPGQRGLDLRGRHVAVDAALEGVGLAVRLRRLVARGGGGRRDAHAGLADRAHGLAVGRAARALLVRLGVAQEHVEVVGRALERAGAGEADR